MRPQNEILPEFGVGLGLGKIDDSDEAWINGQRIGGTMNQWNAPREYRVDPKVLHAGTNHLAIRVTDTGGGGGIHGDAARVFLQPIGGQRRPLATAWKFRPATATIAMDDDKNHIETLLYNQMIHPVKPYPLRGFICYQGEANAGANVEAFRYPDQFATKIHAPIPPERTSATRRGFPCFTHSSLRAFRAAAPIEPAVTADGRQAQPVAETDLFG